MADIKDKRGISVTSPFKYLSSAPLDPRQSVEDIAARDSIVAANAAYVGLKCYVVSENKTYICIKTEDGFGWKEEKWLLPENEKTDVVKTDDVVTEMNDGSLWTTTGYNDTVSSILDAVKNAEDNDVVVPIFTSLIAGAYTVSPCFKLDFSKNASYVLRGLVSRAVRHIMFIANGKVIARYAGSDSLTNIAAAFGSVLGQDDFTYNAGYSQDIVIDKDFIKRFVAYAKNDPVVKKDGTSTPRGEALASSSNNFDWNGEDDVVWLWFTSSTGTATPDACLSVASAWSLKRTVYGEEHSVYSYQLPGLSTSSGKLLDEEIDGLRDTVDAVATTFKNISVETVVHGNPPVNILDGAIDLWGPGWLYPSRTVFVGKTLDTDDLVSMADLTDNTTSAYSAFPGLAINTKNKGVTYTAKIPSNANMFIRHLAICSENDFREIWSSGSSNDALLPVLRILAGDTEGKMSATVCCQKGLVFSLETIKAIDAYAKENTVQVCPFTEGETVYVYMTTSFLSNKVENRLSSIEQWSIVKAEPQTEEQVTVFDAPGLRVEGEFLSEKIKEVNELSKALEPANVQSNTYTQEINLYEEDLDNDGKYINNGPYPTFVTYSGYCPTKLIEIDTTQVYRMSFARHLAIYGSDKKIIAYLQNISAQVLEPSFWKDYAGAKYVCVSNTGTNRTNGKFIVLQQVTDRSFELPGLRLTAKNGVDTSTTFDLFDVDRIGVIGDSYTESHYTIKDKSWLSKLSLFTDYNIENFAVSGDTNRGQLNKIRTAYNRYYSGFSWEQMKPTHAMMLCRTNDVKYMGEDQFAYDLEAILETTEAMGAIPIVSTEYHTNNNFGIISYYADLARRHGGYFVDLYTPNLFNRGTDYKPFWGGSHPGTRTNGVMADPAIHFFEKNMPRPYQSIKIFRPRQQPTSADELLFSNIYERAKKFKEISISHSALTEPYVYDNCTNAKQGPIPSEYLTLMDGKTITFDRYALVDVILPATSKDLQQVVLNATLSANVTCYVRDALAEPYPSPAFCRRFDIPNTDVTFVVGDSYKSSNHGETVYKVISVTTGQVESENGFVDGTIVVCSGDKSSTATGSGTLTKTAGSSTGVATAEYFYSAVGLSPDYPEGKQSIGHWVPLEKFGVVDGSLLHRAMSVDRLSFLLVSDTEFLMKNLSISYVGKATKHRDAPQYSRYIDYGEAITSAGELVLTTSPAPVAITPTDGCKPGYDTKNPEDVYLLTQDTPFTYELDLSNLITAATYKPVKMTIRARARWYPQIFSGTAQEFASGLSPITLNSYDWGELQATVRFNNKASNQFIRIKKPVSTHWDVIEFDIYVSCNCTKMFLELSATERDLQIAKIEPVIKVG
ncbi:MAG: hypothetical protein NC218_02585 [Acetobacter sp.]|nr:hypothetical protein [Acetobacter sp.]